MNETPASIRLTENIYSKSVHVATASKVMMKWLRMTTEIRQGDMLCPDLFLLFPGTAWL